MKAYTVITSTLLCMLLAAGCTPKYSNTIPDWPWPDPEEASTEWTDVSSDYGTLPEYVKIFKAPETLQGTQAIAFIADVDLSKQTFSVWGLNTPTLEGSTEALQTPKQIYDTKGKPSVVINAGFSHLFGYSELSDKQKDQYVKMYLGIVDPKLVSTIVDKDGKLIATGICMPSLSEAIQKSKGKLFPFGWYHILKALKWKHPTHLDMLLIAVRPEWQGKGVNALFFKDLLPYFISEGYEWCETSVEMEENSRVQNQWKFFERRLHKRRRCYKKTL